MLTSSVGLIASPVRGNLRHLATSSNAAAALCQVLLVLADGAGRRILVEHVAELVRRGQLAARSRRLVLVLLLLRGWNGRERRSLRVQPRQMRHSSSATGRQSHMALVGRLQRIRTAKVQHVLVLGLLQRFVHRGRRSRASHQRWRRVVARVHQPAVIRTHHRRSDRRRANLQRRRVDDWPLDRQTARGRHGLLRGLDDVLLVQRGKRSGLRLLVLLLNLLQVTSYWTDGTRADATAAAARRGTTGEQVLLLVLLLLVQTGMHRR